MNTKDNKTTPDPGVLQSELALWAGVMTIVALAVFGDALFFDLSNTIQSGLLFIWLLLVIAYLPVRATNRRRVTALRTTATVQQAVN